jgi:hypothetical protein
MRARGGTRGPVRSPPPQRSTGACGWGKRGCGWLARAAGATPSMCVPGARQARLQARAPCACPGPAWRDGRDGAARYSDRLVGCAGCGAGCGGWGVRWVRWAGCRPGLPGGAAAGWGAAAGGAGSAGAAMAVRTYARAAHPLRSRAGSRGGPRRTRAAVRRSDARAVQRRLGGLAGRVPPAGLAPAMRSPPPTCSTATPMQRRHAHA